jgi:hypothetical protein
MPFEADRFSGAVCLTMLHHVPDAGDASPFRRQEAPDLDFLTLAGLTL